MDLLLVGFVLCSAATIFMAWLIPIEIETDYCCTYAIQSTMDSLESETNIKVDTKYYYKDDITLALEILWDEYNYGLGRDRSEKHLYFLEKYRTENNFKSPSFELINLSNPMPAKPEIIYVETGNISDHKTWQEAGGYSEITMESGNVYTNSHLNPYPFDLNGTTLVFKFVYPHPPAQPQGCLYKLSKYPNILNETNQSWEIYFINLEMYFDNGGVDIKNERGKI